jgi:hypothetical protein
MISPKDTTGTIIGIGGLVWAAGMLLGLLQCGLWLRDGYWTPMTPVLLFGPASQSGWDGVDQIIEWIWLQPLCALIGATGMAIVALGFVGENA